MLPEIFHTVEAVFFDLDNTLIRRDASFRSTLPLWLEKHVPELRPYEYETHIQDILDHDKSGHTDRYEFCAWIRENYDLHVPISDILAGFSAAIVQCTLPDTEVINMLHDLKKRYLIGIISNGSAIIQRAKMMQAGLCEIFDKDTVYIEGERGHAKPDVSIFSLALTDHQIPAEKFLFVGDHPLNDVAGARQAGMKTCWIRNGQQLSALTAKPDCILQGIYELTNVQTYG